MTSEYLPLLTCPLEHPFLDFYNMTLFFPPNFVTSSFGLILWAPFQSNFCTEIPTFLALNFLLSLYRSFQQHLWPWLKSICVNDAHVFHSTLDLNSGPCTPPIRYPINISDSICTRLNSLSNLQNGPPSRAHQLSKMALSCVLAEVRNLRVTLDFSLALPHASIHLTPKSC